MTALTSQYIRYATGEFDEESVFQAILSDRGLNRIESLSKCCNLRWLDLAKNAIIRIEGLDGLTQLVALDLSFNKIQKVQNLESLQSLERLRLKGNPISRLQDLEGLRPARKLRHLQLQNVDRTDVCPVCLHDGYQGTVKELCPDLLALDSRRRHLPDLDREVLLLQQSQELGDLPEVGAWFTAEDLDLDDVQGIESVDKAMRPAVDDFDAAMAECQGAMKEAEELLRLQELAPAQ